MEEMREGAGEEKGEETGEEGARHSRIRFWTCPVKPRGPLERHSFEGKWVTPLRVC